MRTKAALLVGDLRGFSKLARRIPPETAVELLQEFFAASADIAVAHQANIERVVGDTFTILSEAGSARRDDSARAVRTALALQRSFLALRNRWLRADRLRGGQLGLAIGVATGQLVLAELDGVPGIHSVSFGEPLSRASRLCQGARVADVLIDEATYDTARRQLERDVVFESRELSGRDKGIVTAYRARLRRAGLRVVSQHLTTDPVCGRNIHPLSSTERRDYDGAVFHFCSASCARRFAGDPPSWID